MEVRIQGRDLGTWTGGRVRQLKLRMKPYGIRYFVNQLNNKIKNTFVILDNKLC